MKKLRGFILFFESFWETLYPLILGVLFLNLMYYVTFTFLDYEGKRYGSFLAIIIMFVCLIKSVIHGIKVFFPKVMYEGD